MSELRADSYECHVEWQSLSDDSRGGWAVVNSTTLVTHPTVSLDGVWVAAAFQCPGTDRSTLWASPLDTLTVACEGRRISRPNAAAATNPKWGPGVLIAFERGEPPRDIGIVAADTGQECFIQGPGDDRNPSWVASSFDQPE